MLPESGSRILLIVFAAVTGDIMQTRNNQPQDSWTTKLRLRQVARSQRQNRHRRLIWILGVILFILIACGIGKIIRSDAEAVSQRTAQSTASQSAVNNSPAVTPVNANVQQAPPAERIAPTRSAFTISHDSSTIDVSDFAGTIGIYAQNLRTGKTLTYHSEDIFPAASTAKLIVALAVYHYLYDDAYPAEQTRYDNYIDLMMRVSDNDTYAELLEEMHELNPNPLDLVIRDLALTHTMVSDPQAKETYDYFSVTTPLDMALVLEHIVKEDYLSRRHSARLKDALANTIFREEIPRYLPPGVTVMHKVGALDDSYSDVGLIDDGTDQILISIYTRTEYGETYASDYMAAAAEAIYRQLK